MMTCQEIQHRLRKLFDEDQLKHLDKPLEAHLHHCPDCQEVYHQLISWDEALHSSSLNVPAAVLYAIELERNTPSKFILRMETAMVAVAIALLIWIGGKQFLNRKPPANGNAVFAVEKIEPQQPNGQVIIFQKESGAQTYHIVWIF